MTHPTDPAEAMREACAKACDDIARYWDCSEDGKSDDAAALARKCATAIRALPLPAAPTPTRPRVSTAGSGQEARVVIATTPSADGPRAADASRLECVVCDAPATTARERKPLCATCAEPSPAPIATPADDAVARATERVVKAWTRMDTPGAERDLHDAVDALYEAWTDAAERAASDEKGG